MKSDPKGNYRWAHWATWAVADREHTGEVVDGLDGDGGTTTIYPIADGLWYCGWRKPSALTQAFVFTGDGP